MRAGSDIVTPPVFLAQTLQTASNLFEALNDVSSKHAKLVQREYESLNEACAKYFKRIAKEERAHDELVDGLDTKVKKAGESLRD